MELAISKHLNLELSILCADGWSNRMNLRKIRPDFMVL
jgi:hypothetical protein